MSKSKKYIINRPSNFKIKAATTYVTSSVPAGNTDFSNPHDSRWTRADGGRVRPVFYNDDWRPSFEPK